MRSHRTRLLVLGAVVPLAVAVCGAAVAMGTSSALAAAADPTADVATNAAPTNAAGQTHGALPDEPNGAIVTTRTAGDGAVVSQTLEALDGTVTTVK